MTEIIKFDHVTKSYGDKIVIDNLNFSIKTGEIITILGTSGSGKTTTLKMINRLIEPSSGSVIFDDSPIDQLDEITLRRRIGYVVQQIGLFPHQTVEENIATVPKLLNWDKKTMLLVSEDFRKIGTYILGIAFVAMFVQNDNIPLLLAIIIMIFGGIAWFCGVLLAKYCNSLMETDGA